MRIELPKSASGSVSSASMKVLSWKNTHS